MSDARGSPCTHKSSVHWQQNESKGWFSGECGFQGHFICKHNFFYWALSDAILDISINCCDWGCWVTGDSVPWLPDSNPASSMSFFQQLEDKNHLQTFTQLQHLFGWSWFHDPGHQVGAEIDPQRKTPGCKAKSPRSSPKRLLGIPSWEPNFCPRKNAEIGDCKTSKAFSVFFVQFFFSTKNFSKAASKMELKICSFWSLQKLRFSTQQKQSFKVSRWGAGNI